MDSKYYEVDAGKDILSLSRSKICPGFWDFCFNGIPIHSKYTDPDQAAYDFNRGDYGIDWLDKKMKKIYVPSEIAFWRRIKRKSVEVTSN